MNYVVAGSRAWNREAFARRTPSLPGVWHFVQRPEELTLDTLRALAPRCVFFLHWSWLVPETIVEAFECVVFHMTDVPYGRGGSPLQNLLRRGHRETMMSALRMAAEVDAGPVYMKRPLSLEGSTAEEVYVRATELSFDMIEAIIRETPTPAPQVGPVVSFRRRRPAESEIPEVTDLAEVHDFIRMLDAKGYPAAYVLWKGLRIEFRGASLYHDRVEARVTITRQTPECDAEPPDSHTEEEA